MYAVDRELRRAVRVVGWEFEPRREGRTLALAFPPLPISQGGLSIEETEAGSLEVLFAAVGAVMQALLSQPVQLAVTVRELLGWAGDLVVVVKRPFEDRGRTVFTTEDRFNLHGGTAGFRIESVPEGTRLVFKHRLADGTETEIEIQR
jgi:hypothetical protein